MMIRVFGAALACLSLGACVNVLPDSGDLPPRLRLEANDPATVIRAPSDVSMVIHDPTAEAVYNTFNVAIATGPYTFEYVDGAEWSDRVPALFRIYLERRFENAQVFKAVGDRTELATGADYALYTDIRSFHIDRTSGTEIARVSFGARLATRRGVTLETKVFSAEMPTDDGDVARYAAALNMAANQTTEEAIRWAARLISDDQAAN